MIATKIMIMIKIKRFSVTLVRYGIGTIYTSYKCCEKYVIVGLHWRVSSKTLCNESPGLVSFVWFVRGHK